jgi:acyl carrier protein
MMLLVTKVPDDIRRVIQKRLNVAEDRVTLDASLIDLGAHPLVIVALMLDFERVFQIHLPDEHADRIQTVRDVVDYVEKRIRARVLREQCRRRWKRHSHRQLRKKTAIFIGEATRLWAIPPCPGLGVLAFFLTRDRGWLGTIERALPTVATRVCPCEGGAFMNMRTATLAIAALWPVACSGPDLPAGWEHAESVTSFTQAQCNGSAGLPGSPSETVDVVAGAGELRVAYHAAHFRCEQTVEGFVRRGPNSVDFLVQPKDMHPTKVAGCDCLYEITMSASAPSGHTAITVYRRWDGDTSPVVEGSER